jgi:hypothetical protein
VKKGPVPDNNRPPVRARTRELKIDDGFVAAELWRIP